MSHEGFFRSRYASNSAGIYKEKFHLNCWCWFCFSRTVCGAFVNGIKLTLYKKINNTLPLRINPFYCSCCLWVIIV